MPGNCTTSQQIADELLREHQAQRRTSFVDHEKMDAALDLCGAVSSLVLTDTVPDYMKDYLMSRVTRLRRAYGIRDALAPPQITAEQFDDINRRSV